MGASCKHYFLYTKEILYTRKNKEVRQNININMGDNKQNINMDDNKQNNSVLVTGLGIHSCLGTNIDTYQAALEIGVCGLHHDHDRKAQGYQSDLCGETHDVSYALMKSLSRAQKECLSMVGRYAYSVVLNALDHAKVSESFLHNHHVSLIVSNDSTAGANHDVNLMMQRKNDTRYLGAGRVFRTLNSTVSMNLASLLGIHGLTLTVSAACAGGGHALGLAKMLLDSKQTEMVIVVGAQEDGEYAMQSFDAMGVFARDAVRPFCKHRQGLAPSGGAACVILESESCYRQRIWEEEEKYLPLAELSGYGFSSNGMSICTPLAYQESVAMIKAMENAGLDEGYIDVLLAHATGTPAGDEAEAIAIQNTFPICPYVVATKGATGHECWMAGVSQAVQATLMLQHNFLPGVVGTEECAFPKLNLVMETKEDYAPHHILCNSFGFGGTNASFVISRIEEGI